MATVTAAAHQPPPKTALSWQSQSAVLSIAVLLILSRRPDALLNPQFYAEDGLFWFAQAYNYGWLPTLLWPATYLQILPRLAASLALIFPLASAPLVMNLVGLLFQLLPVTILLSGRLRHWGPLSLRAAMAAIYLALPNSAEVNVSVEEAQWHLALAACMLVLADPPQTKTWKGVDLAVFVMCGLTGPFCIMLVPITAVFFFCRRHRWTLVPLVIMSCSALIQAGAILLSEVTRYRAGQPLGAGPAPFIRILTGKIYLGALLGENNLATEASMTFLCLVAFAMSLLMLWCILRAGIEIRLLLAFSALVLAASLRLPIVNLRFPGDTVWSALSVSNGLHYWFLPTLSVAWVLAWCLLGDKAAQWRQVTGMLLLVLMLFGVIKDWRYPPYTDFGFRSAARDFERLPAGTAMTFPENPPGWKFVLIKR